MLLSELCRTLKPAVAPLRAFPRGPPRLPAAVMLAIVCAGVVLASLDLFIVNVALPRHRPRPHQRSLGDLSWVLNGYAIVYASLLVLFGRLADRHRREHGFLLGVARVHRGLGGVRRRHQRVMLVAFRLVQAAGAALLTPTSLGLVLATYPPERRHGAVRAWTAIGGLAAALGPVVGGLLVTASWRWVFLVNVPIGLVALVVGWRRLPRSPATRPASRRARRAADHRWGWSAQLGLVEGGDWGGASPRRSRVLAASASCSALFVLRTAPDRIR